MDELKFSNIQRAASLKLAFDIIDQFAIPSLSPSSFEKYDDVKKILIKEYSKNI